MAVRLPFPATFPWQTLSATGIGTVEPLAALAWSATQLDEALRLLGHKLGVTPNMERWLIKAPTVAERQGELLNHWLDTATGWLGMESEPIRVPYSEVEQLLQSRGPLLCQLPATAGAQVTVTGQPPLGTDQPTRDPVTVTLTSTDPQFLLLLTGGRWWVSVLSADGRVRWVKKEQVRALLCQPLETAMTPHIDQWLNGLALPANRLAAARQALLQERLQTATIGGCWVLRLSPGASFWTQARQAGLWGFLTLSIALQFVQSSLYVAGWGMIGQAGESGAIEWWLLSAGILLWFSSTPFTLVRGVLDRLLFATGLAEVLKQQLLYGVLRLPRDEVQSRGTGHFLAWVLESQTLEDAGLQSQTMLITSVASLIMTGGALFFAGDILSGLLLYGWLGVAAIMGWRVLASYAALNDYYAGMANDLLERMLGHPTRLVQERDWYSADDQATAQYVLLLRRFVYKFLRMWVLIPNGWLLLGILGISVNFVSGNFINIAQGVRFTALLLGYQHFWLGMVAVLNLTRALGAWRMIAPIQAAALQPVRQGREVLADAREMQLQGSPLQNGRPPILEARGLTFRYPGRARPVLNGCSVQIYAGDRVLLEGASGGGKSTLAALLIGLETPEAGLLMLWGLDRHSISDAAWRQRVVAAPQFHENHILSTSFAFNVLLGRRWPPLPEDLGEAETICRELGLGDLLDRMPLGMQQPIGEQGWRLSHGERSRLYIARALLQQADVIILDESFASLDPENMQMALQCVLKYAPALVVIAHP